MHGMNPVGQIMASGLAGASRGLGGQELLSWQTPQVVAMDDWSSR